MNSASSMTCQENFQRFSPSPTAVGKIRDVANPSQAKIEYAAMNIKVPEPLRASLKARRSFGGHMEVAVAAAILQFLRQPDDEKAADIKALQEWMDNGCPESGVLSADDRRRKPFKPARSA